MGKRTLALWHGIEDAPTQRAIKQLEQYLNSTIDSVTTLQVNNSSGGITLPIAMTDVTGLIAALAGKADTSHTHSEADVTGLTADLATKALKAITINISPGSGGGDLSVNRTLVPATNSISTDGIIPQAPNDATKVWRGDASWGALSLLPDAGLFGNIQDGNATFDGATTILGVVPTTSIYILLRDIFCNICTINTSVRVRCGGFRIFARTLLVNGFLDADGQPAGGSSGTGADAQFMGGGTNGGTGSGTGTNGTGHTAGANGLMTTSTAANASSGAAGTTSSAVCRGGGGGGVTDHSPSSSAGGSGGGITITTPSQGGADIYSILLGCRTMGSTRQQWQAGTGGGGGGQSAFAGSTATGGKGGGGAGFLAVCARTLGGTGVISANGGDATAGAVTGTDAAAGGGGGGGGGVVVCIYATRTGSLTITANGGLGKAGAKVGSNTGFAGANGSNGVVILCNTSGDGT